MENVVVNGSYQSTSGSVACFIGEIASTVNTNLTNATIDGAYMYGMAEGAGPVYGINNGTFDNM